MYPSIGKDEQGRYWFKSDQNLTNITHAVDFYVVNDSFMWWKKFLLKAKINKYPKTTHGLSPGRRYDYEVLGEYKTAQQASMALEEVMRVKEIEKL